MTYLKYILLGLVQGLAEFLPISSSGHLAIFKRIFGSSYADIPLSYDILLHVATLIVVFVVYRKDILAIIKEFFLMLYDLIRLTPDFKSPYRKFVLMVIVGSVPAAIAGIAIKDYIEFLPLWAVGLFLFVTAAILFISDKITNKKTGLEEASVSSSFWVGIFQAVAVLPGISRSGSTIAGGLVNGYDSKFATKFSFILSIPAILGAALLDTVDVIKSGVLGIPLLPAFLGMLTATVFGFISIKFLINLVQKAKLRVFSYYCIFAGVVAIILYFI